jgi:hypothetical protein
VLALVAAGGAAGAQHGGLRGAIGGACFMAVAILPMYLSGAYYRAQDSDRLNEGGKQ